MFDLLLIKVMPNSYLSIKINRTLLKIVKQHSPLYIPFTAPHIAITTVTVHLPFSPFRSVNNITPHSPMADVPHRLILYSNVLPSNLLSIHVPLSQPSVSYCILYAQQIS